MRRARGTSSSRLPAAASAALAGLAAISGCAAVPDLPEERSSSSSSAVAPPLLEIAAEDLAAPAGLERTYEVLDGSRAGARIVQRTTASGDGGRVIDETVVGPDGIPRPSERMVLVARDGGFALLEVETREEDSRSLFAEGLPFAPSALTPGSAWEGSSSMQVVRISDGSSRAKGRAERSARIRGTATVELAGERLESVVVEVIFSANLDAARVRRTSELFVVPGRGIVAERWNERLVVLGIFPKSSGETSVLIGSAPLERVR